MKKLALFLLAVTATQQAPAMGVAVSYACIGSGGVVIFRGTTTPDNLDVVEQHCFRLGGIGLLTSVFH